MLAACWKFFGRLLTTPEPVEPPPARRGESMALILAAVVVGGWIFAFHLRRFFGLGTDSDLYVYVQLATSWLDGRFLHDSYFGNYLTVHSYFLCPFLALVAYPFGAPGLFFSLGMAAGFNLIAIGKILRLFGVPARPALVAALLLTLMPLSMQVYQVDHFGFQIELLVPGLALWLAYFLLQRKWIGSIVLGLALQAMKEDALLLIFPVTVAVICEDLFRAIGAGGASRWRRTWNLPALTVCLLSLLATPLLLTLIKSQPPQIYSNMTGFQKVGASAVSGIDSLFSYLVQNAGAWLRSGPVWQWLAAVLAGTFGLIVLRPHLLVLGLATTLTAWLVHGDLMWAPRFAPALAFIQLIGCLGFAAFFRLAWTPHPDGFKGTRSARVAPVVVAFALLLGLYQQHRLAPLTGEIYRLTPALEISPSDRRKADTLYAQYRREGRPEEPVIASEFLFRYVHDRDFYWYSRLRDKPRPVWILWDQQANPLSTLELHLRTDAGRTLADYELMGQAERFLLYRAWQGRKAGPAPEPTVFAGEPHGMVRLKVQPAAGRAGTTEPILSLGPAGRGDLFFVHYLDERHLVLGFDSVGLAVQRGQPVEYEPGRTYEVELFSGSLLPSEEGARAGPGPSDDMQQLGFRNFVSIRWAGREVLSTLAPPHAVRPEEVYAGHNVVRSGSAIARFSGEITEARRGGYPPPPAGGGLEEFGAMRLVVQLPDTTAGLAEPLVVVGVPGDATLGYVRMLPEGKIIVGGEFWSIGKYESESLVVDRAKPVTVVYSLPVCYPPAGDPRWGSVPPAEQAKLRSGLRISVNGAVVVDRKVVAPIPRQPTVAYGKNPVGGSVVTNVFQGRVLQVMREPLSPR